MGLWGNAKRSRRTVEILLRLRQHRKSGNHKFVADLIDHLMEGQQMAACVRRFRQMPGAQSLMDRRIAPLIVDPQQFQHLPAGSLGRAYADLIQRLGLNPSFYRIRPVESEAEWLTQRIASTHDLHHLVTGFSTRRDGEHGVLAITSAQIGFPAFKVITRFGLMANLWMNPLVFARLHRAHAHGLRIAQGAHCLTAVEWESGWERPLSDWRQSLGITEPADGCSYGLNPGSVRPQEGPVAGGTGVDRVFF
jgi:ubiquinone biosynthesis protein Coq4